MGHLSKFDIAISVVNGLEWAVSLLDETVAHDPTVSQSLILL